MPIRDSNSNIASINGKLLDKNRNSWIGNGVLFTGAEVIKTPLTRVLNWNIATPFSVNVIFVQKNNSGYQEIISNRVTGDYGEFCFSISCRLDGTIWVNLQEAGIIGDNLIVPYNLNEVTSITLTYSGALIKAYKNGVLFGQVASTRIIGSNNCFLGRIGNVSGQGFKGIIYDAKIFSKELTQQEVSHLFVTKGADVSATALNDLILNLKLQEKSGTTAIDASPNSYNGTLINFTNTTLGTSNAHVDYRGIPIKS